MLRFYFKPDHQFFVFFFYLINRELTGFLDEKILFFHLAKYYLFIIHKLFSAQGTNKIYHLPHRGLKRTEIYYLSCHVG